MPFEVGQSVGSYELIERLSATEKGVSYKAHNGLARRFEILKVLPAELQSDSKALEHLLREARVHSRLSHPNIAAFYTAIEIEGRLVLCSEYVRGMTVESRRKIGAIPVKLAVDYVRQVLAGLDHAHRNGVVHRNLSPSNMIITDNGVVKLSGFDLAKGASDPNLTIPGSVVGSVDYISPEQIMGSAEIDGRADIYGIGAVLYELLTGQKMFAKSSKFAVMTDHVQTMPPAPSKLRAEIPPELDQAVLKAVAKDPAQRFQRAAEMSEALEKALSGKQAATPQAAGAPAEGPESVAPAPPNPPPAPPPPPTKDSSPPTSSVADAATAASAPASPRPVVKARPERPAPVLPAAARAGADRAAPPPAPPPPVPPPPIPPPPVKHGAAATGPVPLEASPERPAIKVPPERPAPPPVPSGGTGAPPPPVPAKAPPPPPSVDPPSVAPSPVAAPPRAPVPAPPPPVSSAGGPGLDDPEKTQPVEISPSVRQRAEIPKPTASAAPRLPVKQTRAAGAPKAKQGDDMIRLVKLGTLTFVIVLVVFTLLLVFFSR